MVGKFVHVITIICIECDSHLISNDSVISCQKEKYSNLVIYIYHHNKNEGLGVYYIVWEAIDMKKYEM